MVTNLDPRWSPPGSTYHLFLTRMVIIVVARRSNSQDWQYATIEDAFTTTSGRHNTPPRLKIVSFPRGSFVRKVNLFDTHDLCLRLNFEPFQNWNVDSQQLWDAGFSGDGFRREILLRNASVIFSPISRTVSFSPCPKNMLLWYLVSSTLDLTRVNSTRMCAATRVLSVVGHFCLDKPLVELRWIPTTTHRSRCVTPN